MVIIGHRGARGYEPENTLSSIQKAIELGADAIEFDVHISQDNAVVLMHDKTVNRTTNGKGFVSHKTLQELKQLEAGNGEKIPTLQEVLDLVNKKAQVHIELKEQGCTVPVSNIIKEHVAKKGWKYDDFLVSSFNHQELQEFKRLLPNVRIGALIVGLFIQYDRYIALGAYSINLYKLFVNKSVVEKAHEKGLKVFVYTVNKLDEIKKLKSLGVDGIISDYPDRIRR